jgi:hypothetical protein
VNEILVLVPSRGRPQAAKDFLGAWDETTSEFADLMFVCDDDDPVLQEYRDVVPRHNLTVGPRVRLGPTLNREAARWCEAYEVLGFMGDDHRPRTMSWDASVLHTLREPRTHVTYGNDMFRGEDLPTSVFMTGHLVQTLGYFCPPHQEHLYLDDFWNVLGRAVGVSYLPHVVIEHMHPAAGKGSWDERYAEVNHPSVYEKDRVAFEVYLRHVWAGELDRLRSLGF